VRTRDAGASASNRSASTPATSRPRSRSPAAMSSASPSPLSTTRAPCAGRASAEARPIPLVAPVTIATWPAREKSELRIELPVVDIDRGRVRREVAVEAALRIAGGDDLLQPRPVLRGHELQLPVRHVGVAEVL